MPVIRPPAASALPFVDAQPSAEAMAAARALMEAELPEGHKDTLHASIPALRETKSSDPVEAEYARIGSGVAKEPGTGVDLSRYEAPEAPAQGEDKEAWNAALRQAYTSAEYLRGREINLGLLETYGKNAWLVGNSQLEDELRALEKDVEAAKLDMEAVEQARRAVQGNAAGEMHGLEESWRTGVGRMIEAQAAAEGLRQEILERRRQSAR